MRRPSIEEREASSKPRLVMVLAVAAMVMGVMAPVSAGGTNDDHLGAHEWTCLPAYGYTCLPTDTPDTLQARLTTSTHEWTCLPAYGYTCFRTDPPVSLQARLTTSTPSPISRQ